MIDSRKFNSKQNLTKTERNIVQGIGVVYYYAFQDLPSVSERKYFPTDIQTLPLFFGTAIFAFEGIALVQNELSSLLRRTSCFTIFFHSRYFH